MEYKEPLMRYYRSIVNNTNAKEFLEDPRMFAESLSFEERMAITAHLIRGAVAIGHIYPKEAEETVIQDDGVERITFTLDGLAYYGEHFPQLEADDLRIEWYNQQYKEANNANSN